VIVAQPRVVRSTVDAFAGDLEQTGVHITITPTSRRTSSQDARRLATG